MSRPTGKRGTCAPMSDTPSSRRDTPSAGSVAGLDALCNDSEYQFDNPCVRADIDSLPVIFHRKTAARPWAFLAWARHAVSRVDNLAA